MSYKCAVCGEIHDGIADFGFQYPDYYFGVPADERATRIECDSDYCVIDEEDFFIRGVIIIPMTDHDDDFGLGVWVSQKKENFEAYRADSASAELGPYFGWLSNRIPFFDESTLNLETMAHFQGGASRPLIEIKEGPHPLSRAYHNGVTTHAVWAWLKTLEHPG